VREQQALHVSRFSVPEPDVAVVPGQLRDYAHAHPRTALLVVEVADSSLAQNRLTKAAIYAAAGLPEYWIVNLRDGVVEVHRAPDPERALYQDRTVARAGDRLSLVAVPDVDVAVTDLLPEG
jgi:Uma2 family endonuclease